MLSTRERAPLSDCYSWEYLNLSVTSQESNVATIPRKGNARRNARIRHLAAVVHISALKAIVLIGQPQLLTD